MLKNRKIWSKFYGVEPLSNIEYCVEAYLAKQTVSLNEETLRNEYADRTTQVRLRKLSGPDHLLGETITENETLVRFIFEAETKPNDNFTILFLVDALNRNISYVLLSEIINPSTVTDSYKFELYIKIKESIGVDATIVTSISSIDTYSPVTDELQPHVKYRGVHESLIDSYSKIEIEPLLGGLAKHKVNTIDLFDLYYRIPLDTSISEDKIISINIITGNDIDEFSSNETRIYEVYKNNNDTIGLKRYNMFNSDGSLVEDYAGLTELLADSISNNYIIIPYINGALFINKETKSLEIGFYIDKCINRLDVSKYGYRVYNNFIYPNYIENLFNEDEKGLMADFLPNYNSTLPKYLSPSFICYSERPSTLHPSGYLDICSLVFNHYVNDKLKNTNITLNRIDRYTIFREISFQSILIYNIIYPTYKICESINDDECRIIETVNLRNYLYRYKHSSFDLPPDFGINNDVDNIIKHLVPYSGMWYYVTTIENKPYLMLI